MRTPFIISLFLMFSLVAQADTWVGNGKTTSWNDLGNWDSEKIPTFGKSSHFTFNSPKGNAFSFGGTEPFRAASLTFTTNSGLYSFKAPYIMIGGSASEDINDGYILEPIFLTGHINNLSSQTQVLDADLSLGWNTTLNADKANIAISGSLSGRDYSLTKKGVADLLISGPKAQLNQLTIESGRVAFVGTEATINSSFGNAKATEFLLLNGATLTTPPQTENTFNLYQKVTLAGQNKSSASSSQWNLSTNALTSFGAEINLSHGARIRDAGFVVLYPPNYPADTIEHNLSGGSSFYCAGLTLGMSFTRYTSSHYKKTTNLVFNITGDADQTKPQTTLNLGNRSLEIGFRDVQNDKTCHTSFTAKQNARVEDVTSLILRGRYGGQQTTARFESGAYCSFMGLYIGGEGSYNNMIFTGADTRAYAGDQIIKVGYTAHWGSSHDNGLHITEGARLLNADTLYVGRSLSNKKENDYNNRVTLLNGARLETKGALIGYGGGNKGISSNNTMQVSGKGTCWDNRNNRIGVGYADRGNALSNSIFILNSACVTNVREVIAGHGLGCKSSFNKLVLGNGAHLYSKAEVQIGYSRKTGSGTGAYDNLIQVGGGNKPTFWNVGGANIFIGRASSQSAASQSNSLILLPGARIQNVNELNIGYGWDRVENNTLVLAGGAIIAKEMTILKNNGLEVRVTPAGIRPILIEEDVTFGVNSYVKPSIKGITRASTFPILGWKGESHHVQNLKLSPEVDKHHWILEIQDVKKRVFLHYKP